ncbi:MAG: HAD family hydrolase [Ignavibacteriales bacterium]
MRNFDGLLFDIDGTMTSTNELIFAAFNHVAEKYLNKSYTPEELISLFGPPEDEILKELTGDKYMEAHVDYFDFYRKHHAALADAYPGIIDILEEVKSTGIPLAVFTGKGQKASTITLKKLGLYDYFDMIITGNDVKQYKPHPEGILSFVEKYNLKKDRTLLIGDAPADIKAARAAGIKIASVVWDSYAKALVMESNSDYLFHTVEELREFLKNNL